MQQTYTSRERVKRLLQRQRIDRIPNGLGGTETTGIHVLAYKNLKRILGVQDPRCRMSTFMTTALVEPSALEALEGDIILLGSNQCPARFWGEGSEKDWKQECFWGHSLQVPVEWDFETAADGTIYWQGTSTKCPPGGIYFDGYPSGAPVDPRPSPDDYHPPMTIPDESLRALEEAARWLYENTEYSISCGEMITDLQVAPGGSENWWMRLVEEPQAAHDFLYKATEAALSQIELVDQAIGKYADMMQIAHDLGDGHGVTIGPRLWREIYKPHYQALLSGWHERTQMKVNLHCCGSVSDILGDLIECGVDLFNPVQISGTNMSPASLKKRFGERLIFYGGAFDAIQTPPSTPAEVVYETVKENIRLLSDQGGFIFAAVHNIPGDTPEAHLRAILEAYHEMRDQPAAKLFVEND
jgi:uroporphyrinogen decarboxylase